MRSAVCMLALLLCGSCGTTTTRSEPVDQGSISYGGQSAEEWAAVLREAPRLDDDREAAAKLQSGVEAFAAMGAAAVPSLLPLFEDEQDETRYAAARAMARLGSEGAEAVPALSPLLEDADSPDLRIAALRALRALGFQGNSQMERVLPLLRDPYPDVQVAAIEAAAAIRSVDGSHPAYVTLLELAERDLDPQVSMAAHRALGKRGAQLPPRESPIR